MMSRGGFPCLHAKTIVAVSGGADSLCLLHKMRHSDVIAAHFNHNLRADSASDARFVQEFCGKLGVECVIGEGNVREYAEKHKISIETAGRLMRYNFFAVLGEKWAPERRQPIGEEEAQRNEQICKRPLFTNEGYEVCADVATAHNANDNAESIIMHLLRGSGSGGLCGIAPEMDMRLADGRVIHLVRPLINTTRAEIEQYCHENGIEPLHDETNDDVNYFRNKVRHEIMPILYKNSSIETINRTGQILRTENEFFEEMVASFGVKDSFDAKWFNSLHLAVRRRILLKKTKELTVETISMERIDSCVEMIQKMYGGKVIELPDGIEVRLEKGVVRICKS